MKRYLIFGLIIIMLVVGVQGLALDFQNPTDFSEHISCVSGACSWIESATGGNSYLSSGSGGGMPISTAALPMTYAAITCIDGDYLGLLLYDGSLTQMYNGAFSINEGSRVEFKMETGSGNIYHDGVYRTTTGALAQNPSYVGMNCFHSPGSGATDDIIWGTMESQYIFGMPEYGYFLQKDILNSAASGLYRVNTTDPNGTPTLISSTAFTSTFGKNSGTNETVTLSSPTGGTQLTYSTGTAWAGTITWNLTQFSCPTCTAPYGLYQTGITPQLNSTGVAISDWIPYIGSGANIQFDKDNYAIGETATLTVTITDTYYDAIENPHVLLLDIYGNEINEDTAITFTKSLSGDWVGTSTYTWTDDNDEGVYYGLIYATTISDDLEVLMNYDTADVTSNVIISGYVFNAENATVISGAMVNVTQAITTDALTSAADGNYTTISNFYANTPTTIVASKSGFETYTHVFTPLAAGEIKINLTLMPTTPIYTGIALGGIARTPPYNRTIDSATVTIQNGTTTYLVTTNSVGYYIKNNMPTGNIWDIWGSKSGFSNSTIYRKSVVGV